MKPALLLLAQANLLAAQSMLDAVSAMPDDPIPAPPMPTGFHICGHDGNNDNIPICWQITWDTIPSGVTARLDYIGAPGNQNGPQDWTEIQINGTQGPKGEWANLTIQQPATQTVLLRLRAEGPGGMSEPSIIGLVNPPEE